MKLYMPSSIRFISLVFVSLIMGCQIFEQEYLLPAIEVTSISQQAENTQIILNITANDNTLELIGVAYGLSADLSIIENQKLFTASEGEVKISIANLNPETLYYFRVFVANESEYVEAEIISFYVPLPTAPEVPCSLDDNILIFNNITFTSPSLSKNGGFSNLGNFGFTMSFWASGGPQVSVNFRNIPTSGIYTTSSIQSFGSSGKNVFVVLGELYLDEGSEVYVEKLGNEAYIFTFCDLRYSSSSVIMANFIYE